MNSCSGHTGLDINTYVHTTMMRMECFDSRDNIQTAITSNRHQLKRVRVVAIG